SKKLQKIELMKEGGATLAKTAIDHLMPGASALYDLINLGIKQFNHSEVLSISEINSKEKKSQSDIVLKALSTLLSGKYFPAAPTCILIDDAQFSRNDPGLSEFVESLIALAFTRNWPLMIIVTYWQKEWNEDWVSSQSSVAAAIRTHQHQLSESWQRAELKPIEDLGPMLKRELSGLTPEQSNALLSRAGGNPRYLDEIIRFCQRQPRNFIERNQNNALSDNGLEVCLSQSLSLHELIQDRFRMMPREVQETIALASMQGQRFLTDLTIEVAQVLDVKNASSGLNAAEDPHGLATGVESGIAEFSQRIFHEVISDSQSDVMDCEKAINALTLILRKRMDNEMTKPIGSIQQRERILAVGIGLFEFAESRSDRLRAACALSELTKIDMNRNDFALALQSAQRLLSGAVENRWHLSDLSFPHLRTLQSVLYTMRCYEESEHVANAMVESAQKSVSIVPDDIFALQCLSVSLECLGRLADERDDLDQAITFYQKSYNINKALTELVYSSDHCRALAISHVRIGDIARKHGDLRDAKLHYLKSLDLIKAAIIEANKAGTQAMETDILSTLHLLFLRLGDIARDRGNLENARALYQLGLGISKAIAAELKTPESHQNLAFSWERLGDIARLQGDLERAISLYEKCIEIREELAMLFKTPKARLDYCTTLKNLTAIVQSQGNHNYAKALYQKIIECQRLFP
ncbi:MAG: tetratricopeptide repeat protein, partial [Calditrichaeota bacterium]|nr:tetratricopeptide repeat protein [Calditrichota bacterium]